MTNGQHSQPTIDVYDVWPDNPQCYYQPCEATLVLILVTQEQANTNDWTKARFFCKEHGQQILVHATSKLPSGHIVGVVKERDWESYDARDNDD